MESALAQDAVTRASTMHGDTAACHFDGIVRALCVSDHLRHHIKLDNNVTNLAARQAAGAAAQALTECVHASLKTYSIDNAVNAASRQPCFPQHRSVGKL